MQQNYSTVADAPDNRTTYSVHIPDKHLLVHNVRYNNHFSHPLHNIVVVELDSKQLEFAKSQEVVVGSGTANIPNTHTKQTQERRVVDNQHIHFLLADNRDTDIAARNIVERKRKLVAALNMIFPFLLSQAKADPIKKINKNPLAPFS